MALQLGMGKTRRLVRLTLFLCVNLQNTFQFNYHLCWFPCPGLILAGCLCAASLGSAQDDDEAFGGATVALPPFYVEPLNGESWTLTTVEGFELLTTHDRTFARRFVQSYLTQSHLVNQFVPERYRWRPHTPDTFVVVDRKSSRLAEDDAITQILERNRENYLDRARKTIASARQNNADSPALAAVAGLLEFEAGNVNVAHEELSNAVDAGIDRPSVLRMLARIKFDLLVAKLPEGEFLSHDAIIPAIDLLRQAHETKPRSAAVYSDLVEIWENAGYPLAVSDVAILAEGVRSFPRNLSLVSDLAQMQARRGKVKTAVSILKFSAARAADRSVESSLNKLIATVQPPIDR